MTVTNHWTGFAYLASEIGPIQQASFSISNILGGANFAVFVLGLTNPYANRWGAHLGFVLGVCFSTWIYVGSNIYPVPDRFSKRLETELIGCSDFINKTEQWCPADIKQEDDDVPAIANLYWISYMFLGTAGFVVTLVTGSIISVLTGTIFYL